MALSDAETYTGQHVHQWHESFGTRPFRECERCSARQFATRATDDMDGGTYWDFPQ